MTKPTPQQEGQWIKPPGAAKAAWYTNAEARELRDMVAGAGPEGGPESKAAWEEAMLLHAVKAEFSADLLPPGDLGGMSAKAVAEGDAEIAARRAGKPSAEVVAAREEAGKRFVADPVAARKARDKSIAQVDAAADEQWKALAARGFRACAERMETFTTDDVWLEIQSSPSEGRAMGPAVQRAQREGVIEWTGRMQNGVRPENHGRPQKLWRSLMYRPPN